MPVSGQHTDFICKWWAKFGKCSREDECWFAHPGSQRGPARYEDLGDPRSPPRRDPRDVDDLPPHHRGRGRTRSRSRSRSPPRSRNESGSSYYGPPRPTSPRPRRDDRYRDPDDPRPRSPRRFGRQTSISPPPPPRRPRHDYSPDRCPRSPSPRRRDDPRSMGPPPRPPHLSTSREPSGSRDGSPTSSYGPPRPGPTARGSRDRDVYSPVAESSRIGAGDDRARSGSSDARRTRDEKGKGRAVELGRVEKGAVNPSKSAEETVFSLLTLFDTFTTLSTQHTTLTLDLSALSPALVPIRGPILKAQLASLTTSRDDLLSKIKQHITSLLQRLSSTLSESTNAQLAELEAEGSDTDKRVAAIEARRMKEVKEHEDEVRRLKEELQEERRSRIKEKDEFGREVKGMRERIGLLKKDKATDTKPDADLLARITAHVQSLLPTLPPPHPSALPPTPEASPEPILLIDGHPCHSSADAHRFLLATLARFGEGWGGRVQELEAKLKVVGGMMGVD